MKLYQLPVDGSTAVNIDNIDFITVDFNEEEEEHCVLIYFNNGRTDRSIERIFCGGKYEAEKLYAQILLDINDLANL